MSNNISIRNIDPQEITINGAGTPTGITNVYVNGVDVTVGTKAYVIVPTKLSELTNDEGFITNAEETDPTVPSYVKNITQANINSWNNKQDQLVSTQNIKSINGNSILGSGNLTITNEYEAGAGIDITENVISNTITSYNDLTDTPIIPDSTSQLVNDSGYVTKYVNDLENYLSTIDLEKILPKVSDSGSDLYLEDSAAFRMDIKLKPHEMVQHTTTGKNLCPNELVDGGASGITYTVNNDGSIHITGTASARVEPDLYNDGSRPILFKAGTYRNTSDRLIIMYAGGYYSISANNTIIIGSDINVTRIYFRIENGESDLDEIYYPQIIDNSIVDTSYEEYTGGMPSPNPLYPQDIHVTTGENSITVYDKNLLPTNADMWESGHYDASGNKTPYATRMRLKDLLPVKPSTTYYFSCSSEKGFIIRSYNKDMTFIASPGLIYDEGTLTTTANTYYLGVSFDIDYSNYVENTYKLAILYNSITDKSWIPYQSQEYPIDLSEDYLKLDGVSDRLYRNIPSDPDYDSRYENGKWWIRQNVYPVYLTDIGDFTSVVDNGDKYSFYNNNSTNVPRRDVCENPYGKSIYFNNVADGNNNIIESTGSNTVRIDIDKKVGISTIEELTQWINDNQVVAYFPLKSNHYYGKGAVDETLNTELNDLTENNTAYEGGTNISQENYDLPFDVEASVFKMIS